MSTQFERPRGKSAKIIAAGISVRGRVSASEDDVNHDALENHIVSWPLRWPKQAKERRG
jgi:hypothetical protein